MAQVDLAPEAKGFRLTGWHVLAMVVGFFAIVMTVDICMATMAVRTFSGEVADDPYEAGRLYNRTLAERRVQAALGWTNSHLYEIRARDVGWGVVDPHWGDGPLDASKSRLLDVLEDALEVVELAAGGAELGAGRGGDLVDVAPQGLGEELAEQGADHGVVQGVVELDEGAGLRLVQLEYVLGGEQRGTIQVRYQPFKNLVLFGTFGLV